MAKKITKKPQSKVKNHTAPARDGHALSSTWKIPSNETKDTNHKAENQSVTWTVVYDHGGLHNVKIMRTGSTGDVTTTSSSMSINNFAVTDATRRSDRNKTFTRDDFYPFTGRKIKRIDHAVELVNKKGKGPKSTSSTTFTVPAKPTIGAFAFAADTGTASVKITAAKSVPRAERKRTRYTWKVRKGKYNSTTQKFSVRETKVDVTDVFSGGEKSFSYDCTDYQALKDGELYLITLTAFSQGFAGNSESVTKKFVVAPPATTTISNPTITLGEGGRVVVPVRMNRKGVYVKSGNTSVFDYYVNPVDGVILQAAINVAAKSADSVSGDAWTDVGSVDDGDCTHLTANTADLTPEINNYTYIRVKSWRFDSECAPLCRYSNIKALDRLRTTETATNDESAILELTSTSDGTGAYLLIGYDKKSGGGARDDADGTEISWSESRTAWRSNKQPDTFEATWSDATTGTSSDDAGYPYRNIWYYTQQIYIEGLEEGTVYWFRCRRYNDDDNGTRTYGRYCAKIWGTKTTAANVTTNATLVPTVKPTNVALSAPSSVPTGSDVTLSWTYDGGDQTAYRIYLGAGGRVVRSSKTASSSCVLKRSVYEKYVESDGTLKVMVSVSTSRRRDTFTESAWSTVTFADPPVLEADVPQVTAQPATVHLYSTTAASTASITVVALGSGGDDSIGIEPQLVGDDVWSTIARPTWTETTWGATAWYAANVTTAVAATATALSGLNITTETFTGGTDATMKTVTVGDDSETRPYVVIHPSAVTGPYMLVTLTVGNATWDLSRDPARCTKNGVASATGAYLRAPWPYSLSDAEHISSFTGCTITLMRMPDGEGAEEAWNDYLELKSTSDALVALHDPNDVAYTASVEIPAGTDFRDNAEYSLSATVVSAGSGLTSNVADATFGVAWAHQAPTPSDSITVTPYDTTDDDGVRTIGASIQLAEPTGAASTDMADVWRVASDGWHRIAEGRDLDELVVDEYAPYGDAELAYRVVIRTADGDTDWSDYDYTLNLSHTRLDFGGAYLELPYNLAISHSYTKDSAQRKHLGEQLPRGYWGSAHERSSSITSDMVRSDSAADMRLLHELGSYMGPVLVRTPDGCCMEAEVTPGANVNYNSSAIPASIRIREIELTTEHMALVEAETEEEEEEQEE